MKHLKYLFTSRMKHFLLLNESKIQLKPKNNIFRNIKVLGNPQRDKANMSKLTCLVSASFKHSTISACNCCMLDRFSTPKINYFIK